MNQVVLLLLVTSVVTTLCAHIPVKGGGRLQAKDIKNEDTTQNKSGLGSFESRLKDQETTRSEERAHRDATISADGKSEREVKEESQLSTNTHEENHHSKTLNGEKQVYKKTTENQTQNKVSVREQTSSEGDASLTSPKQIALEDDRKVHSTEGVHTHTILDDKINDKKVNLEETRHVVHDSQAHHSYPDKIHHNEQKTVITQDVIDHEQNSQRHHQLNINVHGSGNQQGNQKSDVPLIPSFGDNFEDAPVVPLLPKQEGALKIDNVGEEKLDGSAFEGTTGQLGDDKVAKSEGKHHDLPKHHAHHERHWDHDYDYDRHPIDHHHHHEGPIHKHVPTPAPKIEEKKEVIKTDDTRVIQEESGKKDETVLQVETNTGSAKREEEQKEVKVEVANVEKEEKSTEGSSVISKDVTTHHVHEHHPHHGHDCHEEKHDHHHGPTTTKPITVKDEEGAKIDVTDVRIDSGSDLSSFDSKREEETKVVTAEDKSSAGSTGVAAELPKKPVHHPVKGGHPHHHWHHHEHDYDDDDDSHEYHHHEKFHHRPSYDHHPGHHHDYSHGSPYHGYWTDY
uniref:Uncharacterized protein n=1 Tax=Photinus pyralis TaxID=7054 RepID=A0A1Y1M4Z4_PHOPY